MPLLPRSRFLLTHYALILIMHTIICNGMGLSMENNLDLSNAVIGKGYKGKYPMLYKWTFPWIRLKGSRN